MKLCIISDTHGKHKKLIIPECDVLIHCGDITSIGKEHDVIYFLDWFKSLDQCKYKIFIAGNHDFLFEREYKKAMSLIPDNIIYLQNDEIIIDDVKFYGTPVSLLFNNWAFNRDSAKIKKYWESIPDDTNVLITHCPPLNIMDLSPWDKINIGSISLLDEVMNRIKPNVHCFGHLHDCYGIEVINGITFINASNLNEEYEISNPPIIIEI